MLLLFSCFKCVFFKLLSNCAFSIVKHFFEEYTHFFLNYSLFFNFLKIFFFFKFHFFSKLLLFSMMLLNSRFCLMTRKLTLFVSQREERFDDTLLLFIGIVFFSLLSLSLSLSLSFFFSILFLFFLFNFISLI